jgi:hypothetical protein
MELNVVPLSLHADAQEHMTLGIQWKKDIFADQVDKLRRIKAKVRSSEQLVLSG